MQKKIFLLIIIITSLIMAKEPEIDTSLSGSDTIIHKKYFYKNGNKRSEYSRVNDEFYGTYKRWYENGQLESITKRVGTCPKDTGYDYFVSGNIRTLTPYKNCKTHGTVLGLYENGDTAAKITVINGLTQGTQKNWYENGQLKQTIEYKDDKWHGEFKKYLEDGTLIEKLIYKEGDIVQEFRYFKSGKIRIKATYHSRTDKDITYYDPKGKVAGKIKKGAGEAVMWTDDGNGGYRQTPVKYRGGRKVYE